MAQFVYRANLSAAAFPFLSRNWGRSVIVKQYDQNFNPQNTSQADDDKDVGIPQIYYCENVMPYQQGFQSVGYSIYHPGEFVYPDVADQIILARDSSGNAIYLCVKATGKCYKQVGNSWVYIKMFANTNITVAYVSGVTYIFVRGDNCFKYDFSLGTVVPVTLTGLTIANIKGITYSAGYLLAWTDTTIAWSSTIDPTDFVPSLSTGAGSGAIESLRGTISVCVPQNLGFIAYSSNNAVAAIYTGNSRYPFNFREIVASGGVASAAQVTFDANTGNHYAYTTSGMQLVSPSNSQTILPSVTDFLAGKLIEEFDDSTNTLTEITLSQTLKKRLTLVADRYLVISYGVVEFTHALVYDIVDKRWGKLKVTHVQAFEYVVPTSDIVEIPKDSLAFLQKDGAIVAVDFSVNSGTTSGVLLLGKYQFVRQRALQLNEVMLENVRDGATFSLVVLSAPDGKNTVASSPTLLENTGLFRKFACRADGINHSLLLKGAFSICSVELNFSISGKR